MHHRWLRCSSLLLCCVNGRIRHSTCNRISLTKGLLTSLSWSSFLRLTGNDRHQLGIITHHRESESSWPFVSLAVALKRHADENIILFKLDRSSFNATVRANHIILAILVDNLEASHISITIFAVDDDLFDGVRLQSL